MPRYGSPASTISFGPGPLSSAMKALIGVNVAVFVASTILPALTIAFGLVPVAVVTRFQVWQLVTYMFVHGGLTHLLFNMLALWMFGTELERRWGTRYFLKFYFWTGIGSGLITLGVSWLPFAFAESLRYSVIIGASGAIYGLLMAYAIYYPERPILLIIFPLPARIFVLIVGAMALFSSVTGAQGGVASATHLGGLVVGYLMLRGPRLNPLLEVKYRFSKWKLNRARRKFDVYAGGRSTSGPSDWNRRVH